MATPLITGDGMSKALLQMAATARAKAISLETARLERADSRAVQGGAVCEEGDEWRAFARKLRDVAHDAHMLTD